MLPVLLLTQSLLLPQTGLLPHSVTRRCASLRLQAATEDAATETEDAVVVVDAPTYSAQEQTIRDCMEAWGSAEQEEVAAVDEFDVSQDVKQVKEQLLGAWKLLGATDADRTSTVGLTGFAPQSYQSVLGHYQIFTKPDPMDIFNGVKDAFYMKTIEVIGNSLEGSSMTATLKGGYYVGELGDTKLGMVETYTRLEKDGATASELELVNRWNCAFLSPTLRVCKVADGSTRIYEKLELDAAQAEMVALRDSGVDVDPAVVAAEEERKRLEEEAKAAAADDEDEDDPNDDRPLWQKRIDKADGVKRTANGTPIRVDNFS